MKMNRIITAFMLASVFATNAQTTWEIDGSTYKVDTLMHATIGPGTTETELRLTATINGSTNTQNVYYTTTDLNNKNVEMRAAKAGNHIRMLQTVPDIAAQMDKPGERYFAGVNSDFFNMGEPYNSIGMCISNGFPTNYNTDGADIDPYYIVFDKDGVPTLARHIVNSWEGIVSYPSGSEYGFYVNTRRSEDELIVYSPQWQFYDSWENVMHDVGYTGTNRWGAEVAIRPIGQNVLYGSELKLEVLETPTYGVGNMKIPQDGYVLSAHGKACDEVMKLKAGDIITTNIGFTADNVETTAKELLGGFPIMIKNGVKQSTPSYPEHLSTPEPRTAVGYNADKSKIYMAVVDGRKAGGSDGVTMQQLSSIMANIGCHEAMNFDGGGSSTMYAGKLGLRNVPSSSSLDQRPEGTPRTVVNALFAVAISPEDEEIATIEIKEKKLSIVTGESKSITVMGYNKYGVLINPDITAECRIITAKEIGSVSGRKITGNKGNYSSTLTAVYGTMSYTIPVYLNGGGTFVSEVIEINPDDYTAKPEYYNMQGIKLSEPPKGQIYIRRIGNKVAKCLNNK